MKEIIKTPSEISQSAKEIAKEWIKKNRQDCVIMGKGNRYANIVVKSKTTNEIFYYKVIGTGKQNNIFGAVSIRQCFFAKKNRDNYRFLLVDITIEDPQFKVVERTLDEMYPLMSIPPYKININIGNKTKGIVIDDEIINSLVSSYMDITKKTL